MAMLQDFTFRQPVFLKWGLSEVRGTVEKVYGEGTARRVVVRLLPEESDFVVGEETTVVVTPDEVRAA